MWRTIKVFYTVSILSLSLAMTFSSSFAQQTTTDGVGARTTTTMDDDDDNDFEMGWIGLVGLIGLAGLMPRDRHVRKDVDLKR